MATLDESVVLGSSEKELELSAWNEVAQALRPLSPDAQRRVVVSVLTLLQIQLDSSIPQAVPSKKSETATGSFFTEDRTPSVKEFVHEKQPATDVDRVACLAYYLTHYRNTPHYKTLDISKLNTEAAQAKFSNAAKAVDNATRAGLLVPAIKGNKQISAVGELYVQALPDKNAARIALNNYKSRRRSKRTSHEGKSSGENSDS